MMERYRVVRRKIVMQQGSKGGVIYVPRSWIGQDVDVALVDRTQASASCSTCGQPAAEVYEKRDSPTGIAMVLIGLRCARNHITEVQP